MDGSGVLTGGARTPLVALSQLNRLVEALRFYKCCGWAPETLWAEGIPDSQKFPLVNRYRASRSPIFEKGINVIYCWGGWCYKPLFPAYSF